MPKRKMQFEDEAKAGDVQLLEIEVVLDASGSMQGIKLDTIGGFNSYIEEQKNQENVGDARVSLSQFTTDGMGRSSPMMLDIIYDSIPLQNMKPVTEADYTPIGGTPLLDAVGARITALDEKIGSYNVVPAILFVIITDGDENSSQKYTQENIASMITEREGKGWTFVFLGANQDAWSTGMGYGMQGGNTLNVASGGDGMRASFSALSNSTRAYREAGSAYTPNFFSDDQTAGGAPGPAIDTADGSKEAEVKKMLESLKSGRFQASKPNLSNTPSSRSKSK